MRRVVMAGLALAACASSQVGIETAGTAVYQADGAKILRLAERAALDEDLQISTIAESYLTFRTAGRYYSAIGAPQAVGTAGGFKVSFVVTLFVASTDRYAVSVEPQTWKLYAPPQQEQLAADDPGVPAWVTSLTDHLRLAIYDRARGFVVTRS